MPRRSTKFYRKQVASGLRRGAESISVYKGCKDRIYSDVAWLKKKAQLLNTEVKRVDTAGSAQTVEAVAGGANAILFSGIDQGDGNTNRDGNSVKCVSAHARMKLNFNTSATTGSIVRVMIIKTSYGEGITPTAADMYQNAANILSFQNVDQTRGHKILFDRRYVLDAEHDTKVVNWNANLRHHLKFDASGSADHTYGMLWFLILTDEATNRPTYDYETRVRFVDN